MAAVPARSFLLTSRRFGPLFVTSWLDAFNDNLFKTALLILASYGLHRADPAWAERFATIAGGVFVAPFFLCSALAGQVADRFDRAWLVRWVKLAELVILALGVAGFLLQSLPLLVVVLFLAGVHSAMFTPLKYAILPQHVGSGELMGATGMMEAGGFVAILGGQLLGGLVAPWAAGLAACGLACVGLAASLAIPPAAPAAPGGRLEWNLALETWRLVRRASQLRTVWLCVLGNAWFYVVGGVLLGELIPLAHSVLHVRREVTGLFLGLFSLSVAGGALLVGQLLHGQVSARYVPVSALAFGLFLLDLTFAFMSYRVAGDDLGPVAFLAAHGAWRVVVDLMGAAIAGGVFVVPLYAVLQARSPPAERSRILAANNIVNASVTTVAMAVAGLLLKLGLPVEGLVAIMGGGTLAAAAAAFHIQRRGRRDADHAVAAPAPLEASPR